MGAGPLLASHRFFTQILVRTRPAPLSLLRAVRSQVHAIDPDQQVMGQVRSLEEWITGQPEWARERLATALLGAFSVLALALSIFGLYSVVSHIVARRTNEFGIRMALGARRADVLSLVFRSTALSVGSGLAAGVILSFVLKRVLAAWMAETTFHPWIVVGVILLMLAATASACLLPARRTSSIGPMAALR